MAVLAFTRRGSRRRWLLTAMAVLALSPGRLGSQAGDPGPAVGAPAPAFSNVADNGQTYSLESLRGKWVVLEWVNPSCPYARQHYHSGAMPRLQRQWTEQGVVWLTVSTTARLERVAAFARSTGTATTAILDDLEARTAKAYQPKATPHVFVVDSRGMLIYKGAVDNQPDGGGPDPARNYVNDALTSAMAGRAVETPVTVPYGCALHYGE